MPGEREFCVGVWEITLASDFQDWEQTEFSERDGALDVSGKLRFLRTASVWQNDTLENSNDCPLGNISE